MTPAARRVLGGTSPGNTAALPDRLSLRAYLARLAETLLTPAERAGRIG
ncbi:hypothetical protein GCM10010317_100390 [Streptomyces mirabilis]|nr:hypothetical protein GCM10010317_100390 [Streptomyces mirabilis]